MNRIIGSRALVPSNREEEQSSYSSCSLIPRQTLPQLLLLRARSSLRLFRSGHFDRRSPLSLPAPRPPAPEPPRPQAARVSDLSAFQAGEVIIDRDTDFFHRLRADAFDGFELFGRHVGQRFDRRDAGRTQLLDHAFAQPGDLLQRRGSAA